MNTLVARAVMLALLSGSSVPVSAQDARFEASPEGSSPLDEVVVTAQKRETNLQDTPISVAVLTADGLVARQAISLASLSDGSIPSLRVAPFATRTSALNIGIRGVGASGG